MRKGFKRTARDRSNHWLGEGSDGQDALFVEVEPGLLTIDHALCKFASQFANAYDGYHTKPLSVLVPPQDAVGFHLGFLHERFDVWLWSANSDDLLESAADHFNAQVIANDLPGSLLGSVDLFVYTDSRWDSAQKFAEELLEISAFLSEAGQCAAVLPVIIESGEGRILWGVDSTTSVADFIKSGVFRLESPSASTVVPFKAINTDPSLTASAFVKRHRGFFGKNSEAFCAARFREQDFLESAEDETQSRLLAIW